MSIAQSQSGTSKGPMGGELVLMSSTAICVSNQGHPLGVRACSMKNARKRTWSTCHKTRRREGRAFSAKQTQAKQIQSRSQTWRTRTRGGQSLVKDNRRHTRLSMACYGTDPFFFERDWLAIISRWRPGLMLESRMKETLRTISSARTHKRKSKIPSKKMWTSGNLKGGSEVDRTVGKGRAIEEELKFWNHGINRQNPSNIWRVWEWPFDLRNFCFQSEIARNSAWNTLSFAFLPICRNFSIGKLILIAMLIQWI